MTVEYSIFEEELASSFDSIKTSQISEEAHENRTEATKEYVQTGKVICNKKVNLHLANIGQVLLDYLSTLFDLHPMQQTNAKYKSNPCADLSYFTLCSTIFSKNTSNAMHALNANRSRMQITER